MEDPSIPPAVPQIPELTWRSVNQDDLARLHALSQACHAVDGGLGFMFMPESLDSRYFPDAAHAALGGFAPDGRMIACASVSATAAAGSLAILVGEVHPEYRGRGIGAHLLGWSVDQGSRFLSGSRTGQQVLQISTENLTGPADRLYLRHGFECVFDELVLTCDLSQPLPAAPFRRGVTVVSWSADVAEQFYQAYYAAFQKRPGFPGWTAAQWISHVTEDDFIATWTLLAIKDGEPLGFVIGDIDLSSTPHRGFINQVGVIPAQRGVGLGPALMIESMHRMAADGMPAVDLCVHTNNPGAIQTYLRMGFRQSGRRARYEKTIEKEMFL